MSDSPNRCSRCQSPLGPGLGGSVCAACLIEDVLPAAEGDAEPAAAHELVADAVLVQHFGPYELLEEIGRGGMGVIYKARQPGLDRVVALKMLLAGEFADAKARERLLREAKIAARLAHPGIVTIHDVGEHQGRPYFAMEYVPGRNLAQHCRDGLLSVNTAVRYVEQLARAVHYAHQHGVIHRDLKPANILISPDDEPKLTDFGLTKSLVDPTRTIESAGSPNFMAPEQADSTLGTTGTPTDIFGLGAILYYLLTGRPPALGETLGETLRNVVAGEPIALRQLRPALPRDLETITLKCLEKEPARRYASAAELAEDLHRWQNHQPILARPASAAERLAKWARRQRLVAALGAACVLLFLGGTAAVFWQWRSAVRHAADAARQAYLAKLSLAQTDWRENNLGRMRKVLAETAGSPERGFEWFLLQHWAHLELKTLFEHGHGLTFVVRSPDGTRLASGGMDPWVGLWEYPSGRLLRKLTGHADWVSSAAFSPDGRRLLTAGARHDIGLWDVATGGRLLHLPEAHAHIVRTIAWAPDGKTFASAGLDGFGRIWEPEQGRMLFEIEGPAEGKWFTTVAYSPDGRHLLTGHSDGTVRLRAAADGRELRMLRGHRGMVTTAGFSPNGELIATSGVDGLIKLWETSSGKELRRMESQAGDTQAAAFSPDGSRLGTAYSYSMVMVWEVATGRPLFKLPGHAHDVNGLTFSADGRQLISASGDRTLKIWDAIADRQYRLLLPAQDRPRCGALSADGNVLALGRADGSVTLLDPLSGEIIRDLPSGTNRAEIVSVGFVPGANQVSASDATGVVWFWDLQTFALADSFAIADGEGVKHWFSPDGKWMATRRSAAGIWNLAARRRLFRFQGHGDFVEAAAFSPLGDRVLTGGWDPVGRIWEVSSGKELLRLEGGHADYVMAVAFSPDGRQCLTGGTDGLAILWNAETGREIRRFDLRRLGQRGILGAGGDIQAAGFVEDSRRLITADSWGAVRLWHAELGVETLALSLAAPAQVLVDPRLRYLATIADEVRVWPAATPEQAERWLQAERDAPGQKR